MKQHHAKKRKKYQAITKRNYVDNLDPLENTPAQAESLLIS